MTDSGSTVLDVAGLSIGLPPGAERALAVDDVSFELRKGEILCVVGESGSGKSMIANAVMGLLPKPHVRPVAGAVRFRGRDLLKETEAALQAIRGKDIGMIFQEPMTALNPVMTIERQIVEVFDAHAVLDKSERKSKVLELLSDVGLPDPELLRRSYPFRLSGGQRQRVMIAMALALRPEVLIADEPTTALDVTTQAQILSLICRLQSERDMGIMFVTHDFGIVSDIADRVAVMQLGKLVEVGRAADVLRNPQHDYTRRLLSAVPAFVPKARPAAHRGRLLSIARLDMTYRGKHGLFTKGRTVEAAKEVSLDVRKGETLGLVGESGSGKSTIGRCIVRLLEPSGGSIRLGDIDISRMRGKQLHPIRKRVQMIFQDPYASLNPRRKVGRIISEGPMAHGVSEAEATARTIELLELVGLGRAALHRYAHEFSGGQRQRIGIARALALDPELLVADEPLSALDVSVQAQILELLASIKERLHLAMLFITHDLRVAAQICDRIAVMQRGRIVEHGDTADVFTNPTHPYTRELIGAVSGLALPSTVVAGQESTLAADAL